MIQNREKIASEMTVPIQDVVQARFLKVKVTTARSIVKSWSHYHSAHIQPPTYVPTNFQLAIPICYSWTIIDQCHYTKALKVPTKYEHCTHHDFLRFCPKSFFPSPANNPDTMGESNTHTAFEACGVKTKWKSPRNDTSCI